MPGRDWLCMNMVVDERLGLDLLLLLLCFRLPPAGAKGRVGVLDCQSIVFSIVVSLSLVGVTIGDCCVA